MTEPIRMIIYLIIGLFSGFMSGMFGIGGGSVRIPLLNLAGLPLLTAFGINMFVIPFSSLMGAFSHRKNIDLKIGAYMILGGTLGSLTGAFLAGSIPTKILAIIFFVVSIITVMGIYLGKILPRFSERISPTPPNILIGAFVLNIITGMRGGSGGSLFPPFLKAMKLDVHRAIATSLFVTIFTAIAALFIYLNRGDIIWMAGFSVLIGSVAGARIGSKISLKTKPMWLEIGLSIFVLALAISIIYKTL